MVSAAIPDISKATPMAASSTSRHPSSGYFGVEYLPHNARWRAFLEMKGCPAFEIGLYNDKATAACMYDQAAMRLEGAPLNGVLTGRGPEQCAGNLGSRVSTTDAIEPNQGEQESSAFSSTSGSIQQELSQADALGNVSNSVVGFSRSSKGTLKRTSKYAGVCYDSSTKKWRCYLTVPGVKVFRDRFDVEEEAADRYDSLVNTTLCVPC